MFFKRRGTMHKQNVHPNDHIEVIGSRSWRWQSGRLSSLLETSFTVKFSKYIVDDIISSSGSLQKSDELFHRRMTKIDVCPQNHVLLTKGDWGTTRLTENHVDLRVVIEHHNKFILHLKLSNFSFLTLLKLNPFAIHWILHPSPPQASMSRSTHRKTGRFPNHQNCRVMKGTPILKLTWW